MKSLTLKKERNCTKCSKTFLAHSFSSTKNRLRINYRSKCNQCRNISNLVRIHTLPPVTKCNSNLLKIKKGVIKKTVIKLSKEEKRLRTNNHNKKWRLENPEKWKASNRLNRHNRRALGKINSSEWIAKVFMLENKCQLCFKTEPEVKITIDHIIPVSKGGTNDIDNLQPLCFQCNRYKYNSLPAQVTKTTTNNY